MPTIYQRVRCTMVGTLRFAHPTIWCDYLIAEDSTETIMQFWIRCTGFETGKPIHINIALVGSMSRDGERTVLTYVGDGQTIDVTETPEQILERHLGPMGKV